MKYTHLIATAVVGLALPSQAATVLIGGATGNGNFEAGGAGANLVDKPGWTWKDAASPTDPNDLFTNEVTTGTFNSFGRVFALAADGSGGTFHGASNPGGSGVFQSDVYSSIINAGDSFNFSGFFRQTGFQNPPGGVSNFRATLIFFDGAVEDSRVAFTTGGDNRQNIAADTATAQNVNYVESIASHTYTGDGADSVSLRIQIFNNGGQTVFDNFELEQVPEPSTALLAGLGVLGLIRRRRA